MLGAILNADLVLTADGLAIAASFHGDELSPAQTRGAVLMVPAMGTPQHYYARFATWLAAQGYRVATFDYRGTGLSRPRRLRGFRADILAWAKLDCAAMIEALAARAPGLPLYWIGHSLGGQILPFVPNHNRVARAVLVASGSGYWRDTAPYLRPRAWWLWFLVAPLAVALCGYFPGKTLRIISDLPKDAMLQWRRWCLHPDYMLSEGDWVRKQLAAVTTPITSLSFPDDEYMSARSTEALDTWYANAPRKTKRIAPQDLGVPRIGHFGFFRAGFERSLWQDHLLPELR
jgi:predicted alpha/beta hydrolase